MIETNQILEVMKKHNVKSVAEFSRCCHIPYNTAMSWTLKPDNPNYRKCPDWLPALLDLWFSVNYKR